MEIVDAVGIARGHEADRLRTGTVLIEGLDLEGIASLPSRLA
ncbi:MAG: hypothetical protein U0359_07575 [Byssovorax sp.]